MIKGAGFIGSPVVDTLIQAGHQVSVVDNLWEHDGGKLGYVHPAAIFHQIDIREAALAQVFEKEQPEAVCHLAAQHSVKISTEDPIHDAQVNILGLINLLQNAARFGVRKVIFSSSGATHGMVETMPSNSKLLLKKTTLSMFWRQEIRCDCPVPEFHTKKDCTYCNFQICKASCL